MDTPGRACPIHYRTRPEGLRGPSGRVAETVYIVGGLYGNQAALEALMVLRTREEAAGLARPALLFNGDFNWFNAEPNSFRTVNAAVLQHHAIQGNVEAELAHPTPGAGCGCAYPDWVDADTVERSNLIMARLQTIAARQPEVTQRLTVLPRQMTVHVGTVRVGVVHGDPESLAGWGLAVETMPAPGVSDARIDNWFRRAGVDVLACSHTCLPYAQDFRIDGQRRIVINNGAAGMPNFRGDRRGVITRISTVPAPFGRLYGTSIRGVHCEALALAWDTVAWDRWFQSVWPEGSPAWHCYRQRLLHGPAHRLEDAQRFIE